MSEQKQDISLCQAFDCFRIDSAACGDLFPVAPHSHYFSEVLLVRSGTCRITRGSRTILLGPGELMFVPPLVRHSLAQSGDSPVVLDVVKFSASRLLELPSYLSVLRSFFTDAARYPDRPVPMTAEEVKTWHLDSIVQECIVENEKQAFAWDLHIHALLYLLITNLARFWLTRRESLPVQEPAETDPIMDIPAYIEQHIAEPLRVEDLARRCSLSYPWFAKRFHEIFGLSCKQFIERIRMQAVEQYLVYSDLDLSQISKLTGYTDSSHMVKDFRRMTGTTPGQFRSTMKTQGRAPFSCYSGQTGSNHPSKG